MMTFIVPETITEAFTMAANESQAEQVDVAQLVREGWSIIGASWPLKDFVAANPLQGLTHLHFEQALKEAQTYFQRTDVPNSIIVLNQATLKWLPLYFDIGQASIMMPNKDKGLLEAFLTLAIHDKTLHHNKQSKMDWLAAQLYQDANIVIKNILAALKVVPERQLSLIRALLSTLPGWAAHIQYESQWAKSHHAADSLQSDYLAMRCILLYLLDVDANALAQWFEAAPAVSNQNVIDELVRAEQTYRQSLLADLSHAKMAQVDERVAAQFVFCIDVRSEPMRRAIESVGHYETYGFAGFFGLPVQFKNILDNQSYQACPVLLTPTHEVPEHLCPVTKNDERRYHIRQGVKQLYQSVKYNFTTPFALAEMMGPLKGLLMACKTMWPRWSHSSQKNMGVSLTFAADFEAIPFEDRCAFAKSAIAGMGLKTFAPFVVFCGHEGQTENNAFSAGLECGACAGHSGARNAQLLANILNDKAVRRHLQQAGVSIPADTVFLGAVHNTTTDDISLIADKNQPTAEALKDLRADLAQATRLNIQQRAAALGIHASTSKAQKAVHLRATTWSEVRPEWGLARNASFIVGPRQLTKQTNLEGRAFLHSYYWEQDETGDILNLILSAPMVVAQWINSQYLFSTLDNVAFGAGNKITHNIVGKIGVMQGNASDLMHGLPAQSVFADNQTPYHEPMRLMTVVYAPRAFISQVVQGLPAEVRRYFTHGWVTLACIEPSTQVAYTLSEDLTWVASK